MPFVKLTKKDIAKDMKIMVLEIPLFAIPSCEAVEPQTCKKCWWCKERYWGFGEY